MERCQAQKVEDKDETINVNFFLGSLTPESYLLPMGQFSREILSVLSSRAAPEQVPFLLGIEYHIR